MIIEEFKSVALLNEISVGIISKGNAVLGGSATACIVSKGVTVIRCKLSAICPRSGFAAILWWDCYKKRATEVARKTGFS